MDSAQIELTDRLSSSGAAAHGASVTQQHVKAREERTPFLNVSSDLVPAQPDTIADCVARRRRETRMRRLAKVPIPLDQRIVQGPLREPKVAKTVFGAQIGNVQMSRELGEGIRQSHGESVSALAHSTHGDHTAYPLSVNDANIRMVTQLPHSTALGDMLYMRQEIFRADGEPPA